jgi:hypothetical protein
MRRFQKRNIVALLPPDYQTIYAQRLHRRFPETFDHEPKIRRGNGKSWPPFRSMGVAIAAC